MSEINKTIAELWTKTYQGVGSSNPLLLGPCTESGVSDIDNISIKSDSEGKGVGGRSYNYRVRLSVSSTLRDSPRL